MECEYQGRTAYARSHGAWGMGVGRDDMDRVHIFSKYSHPTLITISRFRAKISL